MSPQGIHTEKYDRCVKKVQAQERRTGKPVNPNAVCMASMGRDEAIRKSHRDPEYQMPNKRSVIVDGYERSDGTSVKGYSYTRKY